MIQSTGKRKREEEVTVFDDIEEVWSEPEQAETTQRYDTEVVEKESGTNVVIKAVKEAAKLEEDKTVATTKQSEDGTEATHKGIGTEAQPSLDLPMNPHQKKLSHNCLSHSLKRKISL